MAEDREQSGGSASGGVPRRQFLGGMAAAAAVPVANFLSTSAAAQTAPAASSNPDNILIKGGYVLSLDRGVGDLDQADVLIRSGKIVEIRPNIQASDVTVIDAARCIVMPGFVDTHRHTWETSLRNIIASATLVDYLDVIQRKLGPVFTPDDVRIGNYVGALGAIDAGITNLLDWSHIQNSPEHTDAAIQGLADSGIRAVFAYGSPTNGRTDWWNDTRHRYPADIVRLRKQYFSSSDQLMTLALATINKPEEKLLECWKYARDVGARITMHCGLGPRTKDDVESLGRQGVLKDDITYVHACTLSDTEWKMVRDTGGTVSVAGYVELVMGHGPLAVQKSLDFGIRPSLSIDVETTVPSDMFTQMRTVLAVQRRGIFERSENGEKNLPPLLTARDVVEFATIEGARANGLDAKIGTLTPGKEADIIVLRTDEIGVMPLNTSAGAVVGSMGPANIDTVLIKGKIRKRNGKLVGIDIDRVRRQVEESRDRVLATAKLDRSKL